MGAREIILSFLGKLEDFDTETSYRSLKPLMQRYGVDMKITRNSEERVFYLTQLMINVESESGIKEMMFALGGDDGDLDEVAHALENWAFFKACNSHIKITGTPDGKAPEDIRALWKGIELCALPLRGDSGNIDRYAVLSVHAITELGKKSENAANWFRQNMPGAQVLSFGVNEVQLIS